MVVLHERRVVQVEPREQLADDRSEAVQREVGVAAHRFAVGAERERRNDAAMVGAQVNYDRVPHARVHQSTAQQHQDRALAAAVVIFDRPRRQLDLGHLRRLLFLYIKLKIDRSL